MHSYNDRQNSSQRDAAPLLQVSNPLHLLTKPHVVESKEGEVSHIDKLKAVLQHQNQASETKKTDCFKEASNIVLLLGEKNKIKSTVNPIQTKDFFQKKNSHYVYPTVEELFLQPAAPEHCIFNIEFNGTAHGCVIEKESNNGKTQYRIYQSWINKFTMLEWLEGKGANVYTPKELQTFIEDIISQISTGNTTKKSMRFFCCCSKTQPESETDLTIITKYKFNPRMLDRYYKNLAVADNVETKVRLA